MNIRIASSQDFDCIWNLIQRIIIQMHLSGFDHWDREYPIKDMIQNDIKNKTLHIAEEDNKPIAIVTIDDNMPIPYKDVDWSILGGKYLVVHRLAVAPEWQGKGIAGMIMDFIEQMAIDLDCDSIRLDSYSQNLPGRRLYEHRNYRRMGEVFFPGYTLPFFCYEKYFK